MITLRRFCAAVLAIGSFALLTPNQQIQAEIVYNFENHPIYQVDGSDAWEVSGTISLNDGTYSAAPTGKELSLSDFVSWTLTVTKIAGSGLPSTATATWTLANNGGGSDTGDFQYTDLGIFGTPTELKVFADGANKRDVQFKSNNPLKVNIHFHDNTTAANRKYDGGIDSNNEWRTDDTSPILSGSDQLGMTVASIPEPSSFLLMAIGLGATMIRRRQSRVC